MKELRQTFAIAVILLLAGCGPGVRVTKIDSPTAAQLNSTMRVIEGPAPQRAQLIGPVDATSCMNKAWDPSPTNANAILQLKSVARERGANAIGNVYCEPPQGTSLGTNCWSSINCTAQAYSLPG